MNIKILNKAVLNYEEAETKLKEITLKFGKVEGFLRDFYKSEVKGILEILRNRVHGISIDSIFGKVKGDEKRKIIRNLKGLGIEVREDFVAIKVGKPNGYRKKGFLYLK